MSLSIVSVELSNIRNHEYIFFEPSLNGVTSILGENGSGKSTVVDAILWTIFGTKLGGTKNKDAMKDDVLYEKDAFFSRVIIEIDGQNILAEKKFVSKSGNVELRIFHAEKHDDDSPLDSDHEDTYDEICDKGSYRGYKLNFLAGPAVSHAQSYMRQRLRMDEKGFLSAVFVQQKQVDQLISATAKERAAVIEDLTGITVITNALTDARKKYRDLKEAATHSQVDDDGIEEAESTVYALAQKVESGEDLVRRLTEKLGLIREEGVEFSKKVSAMKENYDKRRELEAKLASLKERLADHRASYESLQEDKRSLKEVLGGNVSADTARHSLEQKNKAQSHFLSCKEDYVLTQKRLEDVHAQINQGSQEIDEFLKGRSVAVEELSTVAESLKESITEKSSRLEDAKSEISSLESQVKSLRHAVEVLTQENGTCPTCLQSVNDTDEAVGALNTSIENHVSRRSIALESVAQLSTDVDNARSELLAVENIMTVKESVDKHRESMKSLQDHAESSAGVLREAEEALKYWESKAQDASRLMYQIEEYQKVREKTQSAYRSISALEIEKEEVKEALAGTPKVDKERLRKNEEKLQGKRDQHSAVDKERLEAEHQVAMSRERKSTWESRLKVMRQEREKYQELMGLVNTASGSVKILEEFRRRRIEYAVPVLESYASDFIEKFTDGKFIRLKVDSSFRTSVVLSDGRERAVSALSGGELSAAAIALRMAISMLLSGGENQGVVLDEVLVSMDAHRAHNIMHSIKKAAQGQLIFIAHHDAINSIADKVFELPQSRTSSV